MAVVQHVYWQFILATFCFIVWMFWFLQIYEILYNLSVFMFLISAFCFLLKETITSPKVVRCACVFLQTWSICSSTHLQSFFYIDIIPITEKIISGHLLLIRWWFHLYMHTHIWTHMFIYTHIHVYAYMNMQIWIM